MDESELQGRTVLDSEGGRVGKISAVYIDPDTQRPQWGLIHTGLFGTKASFVPLINMQPEGDDLRVPYAKGQISDAPKMEAGGELSVEEEATLARHYGLGYSTEASPTGVLTEGQAPPTPSSGRGQEGQAMTRSEEQIRVGTMRRPSELVRLRKTVVTEPVSQTVPVQREDVRIEREPITDQKRGGPEISEAEHEVILNKEEPVVEKTTVPVERVRVEKDVTVEEREITDEVRKERIEVDRQSQEQS